MIERQLAQMVRLIDDLLDVSRITRGRLSLRKERVELAPIIRSAIDTSRPLIDASGHTLAIELPEEVVPLDADPIRLAQVFSQPAEQRGAVHGPRRPDLADRAKCGAARSWSPSATPASEFAADALPTIFDMFTQVDESLVAVARRPRHRPDAREAARGAARRPRRGVQRRAR